MILFKNAEWQRLRRLASGSAMIGGANIASAVMMLMTIPFIIHSVGMVGYGVLIMVQAFALMLTRIFDGQAWQVYIRVVGLGYDKSAALRIGFILDALAMAGVFLAATTANRFMQMWQTQIIPFDICALLSISILNQCVFSWVGVLRLEGKFLTLAMITLLPALFRLLAVLILSMTMETLSLRAIAWIFALTEIIRFIYTAWCGGRLLGIEIIAGCKKSSMAWAKVKNFTFWNWLMNLVDLPVQYLDSLLVGRLLSLELLGVYGVIKRIASVCSQISAPLYQVIFPEFTRLASEGALSVCRQLVWRSAWVMLGIGLAGMLLLFLLHALWMPLFGLPLEYAPELFFFMGLQIAALAFTAIHPLMNVLGLVRAGFYIILFSNLIFLGLLYILGLHYALMGIITAAGVQFALVIIAKVWLVEKHIRQERLA